MQLVTMLSRCRLAYSKSGSLSWATGACKASADEMSVRKIIIKLFLKQQGVSAVDS